MKKQYRIQQLKKHLLENGNTDESIDDYIQEQMRNDSKHWMLAVLFVSLMACYHYVSYKSAQDELNHYKQTEKWNSQKNLKTN